MAKGINKVILIGNLGADPETRETSHSLVCTLRIATSETWTDKQTGQKQERTEWHQVVFFGRMAEVCADYLRKGKQVYIEGQLRTEQWTDQNGVDRYSTKIYGQEMQMLGAAGSGASAARQASAGRSEPAPAPAQPSAGDSSDRYGKARG